MNSKIKSQTLKQMELVLSKLPGDKCMLVDPNLIRPLDRATSMKFLSALSVCKVYKIQQLPPEASFSRLVYVIPPSMRALEVIFNHAEVDRQNNIKRTRLVVFVPKQVSFKSSSTFHTSIFSRILRDTRQPSRNLNTTRRIL
ncbi:unnamed protein product [Dibothriocephalus latus]|uniref:Uncharacterized protein n=1 Tax=Dibothriocephalus latus TaxID=60516 RepID=A0A3P7LDP5_DIBLA|nr:unnamed protein product [Dibothriocephalus latus]